jgi:serine/threonine-protein kinase Chk2
LAIQRGTGTKFAVKVIDKKKYFKQAGNKRSLMDEVDILKAVSHPNIISIEEVYDTEKTLYIVLEL